MDRHSAQELIKVRKAIKRKVQGLQADMKQAQLEAQEKFKPIYQPLKELISTIKTEPPQIKTEPIPLKPEEAPSFLVSKIPRRTSTPKPARRSLPALKIPASPESTNLSQVGPVRIEPTLFEFDPAEEQEAPATPADVQEALQDEVDLHLANHDFYQILQTYHQLPRKYIEGLARDTKGTYDVTYGVRFDPEEGTLMLGDAKFEVDGRDIVVHGIKFKGTPGLYDLIFKKIPVEHTNNDLTNYRDILQRTNAHKVNHDPTKRIKASQSGKYRNIIKILMETPMQLRSKKKVGKGLLEVTGKAVDYVPWKDPNKLVNRLRVLHASQAAGNTSHTNEITNIIEELKEAKVIK